MSAQRDDGLFHGRELDEAMELAEQTPPPEMPICPSALNSRTKAVIERQLAELRDPSVADEIRKSLMDAGAPFDDDTVKGINFRSTIGGTFTLGVATGLALVSALTVDQQGGGEAK